MTKTTPCIVQIVDDDAADTKHLQSILATSGYVVRSCGDCDTFLAEAAGLPQCVVVLDLRMPGMGGLELLRRLGTARPDLPVVMVSGRGDIRSAVKAIKAGACDFLEKPVDPEELVEVVRQVATRQGPGMAGAVALAPSTCGAKSPLARRRCSSGC